MPVTSLNNGVTLGKSFNLSKLVSSAVICTYLIGLKLDD